MGIKFGDIWPILWNIVLTKTIGKMLIREIKFPQKFEIFESLKKILAKIKILEFWVSGYPCKYLFLMSLKKILPYLKC